jgi:SHS2 domain-containing protein
VVDGRRGHRALPHTADVILEAWGPDLPACCEEAVGALAATYVAPGAPAAREHRLHLPPGPDESLLLDLIDEVIFVLDAADAVPVRARVARAADGGLDVRLALAARPAVTPAGAVPKAVSRSELRVDAAPGAVRCRFLVDV